MVNSELQRLREDWRVENEKRVNGYGWGSRRIYAQQVFVKMPQ